MQSLLKLRLHRHLRFIPASMTRAISDLVAATNNADRTSRLADLLDMGMDEPLG